MSQCLTQKEPVRYTNKLIKKTTDTKLQRILAVNKKITAPPMPLYLFCLVYCFQVGLLYNRWNWAILDLHATYLHLKITMWLLLFLMCLPQCAVVGCCSLLGIHSPISSHLVQWLWTLSYQITSTECHLPISQYRRNLWCRRCPIISEGMNGTGLSLMPKKRCFTNRYADGGLTAIVSIVCTDWL